MYNVGFVKFEDISEKSVLTKKNGVEIATAAFQKALSNMRELAEMAARTQSEAFEVIRLVAR